MPVMWNVLEDVSGDPATGYALITLVRGAPDAGWSPQNRAQILGRVRAEIDPETGRWEADLLPSAQISQPSYYVARQHVRNGPGQSVKFTVPGGDGPYWVGDYLSTGELASSSWPSLDESGGVAVWYPSDAAGGSDMTEELETFRVDHPGMTVKVAEGSTILLKNAFKTATTGDILLDLTNVTVLYGGEGMSSSDYAIFCDNTANASAEVAVDTLAIETINTDATVSKITLASGLQVHRFDWLVIYSSDPNPASPGGYLGECFQALDDEVSRSFHAGRPLNRHSSYQTNVKCRKLDGSRKVHIRGGRFRSNGDAEDLTITTRMSAILVRGFVDIQLEDYTLDRPWTFGTRIQCCAAPRVRGMHLRDVGNLANAQGYTYGVQLYGMVDAADIRDCVVRNGRHPAVTTDGDNSSGPAMEWYKRGIPTNPLITDIHGYNCHGSVVDAHEEGDNVVFQNIVDFYPFQDRDINPNFSGLAVQLRAANCTVDGLISVGGTRGVKVNAIDHGFEDQVTLNRLLLGRLVQTARTDGDTAVQIDDQSALAHKRHVYIDGEFNDVGKVLSIGKTAKVTVSRMLARRMDTLADVGAGAQLTFTGQLELDYRSDPRTPPFQGILCRSDLANGGCQVLIMRPPVLLKGSEATPTYLLVESDTTANKTVWCPGLIQHNPSGVTLTQWRNPAATTFVTALVAQVAGDWFTSFTQLTDVNWAGATDGQYPRWDATAGKLTPSSPPGVSYAGMFGDGSDGSATLDGTATVAWASKSGSVYTLTRDVLATNLTVNAGVTLTLAGRRIFATGTLTVNGTLNADGNAGGSDGTAGASTSSGTLVGGTAGGAGATGAGTNGSNGGNAALSVGAGGAGGAGSGGTGGAASTVNIAAPATWPYVTPHAMLTGTINYQGTKAVNGGASGGGGGGDGAVKGGGGGGGGGLICVFAHTVTIGASGVLRARGGAGGSPASGNAGGGGGGGGGLIVAYTLAPWSNAGTTQVTGGTGGTGTGTGVSGGNGGVGAVLNQVIG